MVGGRPDAILSSPRQQSVRRYGRRMRKSDEIGSSRPRRSRLSWLAFALGLVLIGLGVIAVFFTPTTADLQPSSDQERSWLR